MGQHDYSPYGHPQGHTDENGNWVLNSDVPVDSDALLLKLAIGFATADAAVLYTVPTGKALTLIELTYEVTADFTGGTGTRVGASSSATGATAKGSLIGGAAGDSATALTTGERAGTKGSAMPIVLPDGSTIRWDRIASAFTAGAGFLHVRGTLA